MTSAIMVLHAQTPLHAGTGKSTGAVDLPVQREGHTGWPCVYGSSLKGAVRMACQAAETAHSLGIDVVEVFGPEPRKAGDDGHAGALTVSDGRLLLLPVRSLTGHFKYVTCPEVLRRLLADMLRLGLRNDKKVDVPEVPDATALISEPAKDAALFLEDYRFETAPLGDDGWIDLLSELVGAPGFSEVLREQLVQAHVCLSAETKTVEEGPWYEESLPPDTVLYATLQAQAGRSGKNTPPEDILATVTDRAFSERPYLQVGANETTGMGWCRLNFSLERAA